MASIVAVRPRRAPQTLRRPILALRANVLCLAERLWPTFRAEPKTHSAPAYELEHVASPTSTYWILHAR